MDPMIAECMRPASSCPLQLGSCSQVKGLDGDTSEKCRKWFENKSKADRSALAESYCFKYDTEDCRCINRMYNEDYKILKAGNPIADKCWYLPCSNPDHYFLTSEDEEGTCPDKVCEVVYDIYKDRDVNILKNNVVCNLTSPSFAVKILDLMEDHGFEIIIFLCLAALYYVNSRPSSSSS